jgi:hypothetical protein
MLVYYADAPCDLQCGIAHYFPSEEWENAANISFLESKWNRWALADTTDAQHPCGSLLRTVGGIAIYAERSYSYFQINSCLFPTWPAERLWNADHNVGTAHLIWGEQGWAAWYYSAKALGLI